MKPSTQLATAVFLALLASCPAAALDAGMERRVLFGPESAKEWSVAESTLQAAAAPGKPGGPALHWHITVDHFAGEAKYPIGWPRASHAIPAGLERDWSAWDFLRLRVCTSTSRPALPREPVGLALYMPDRESAYHRPLSELKKGESVEITIPLSELPPHYDVRLLQLNISESRYQHKDELDLYIEELCLLRYAKPTLLSFAAERAVMYADARHISVRFELRGVKPEETQDVAVELRRDGVAAARSAIKAGRGPHRLLLMPDKSLQPGAYDVVGRIGDGAEVSAPQVRLVESPWKP